MQVKIKNKSVFLIAAPKSNSGKTIITLGLMHALVKRGLTVQPFKCGPDYIDPMHHAKIARRPSYNLDLWMSSGNHVTDIFNTQLADADIGVVEGVMGLFDGARKDDGSSASISKLLNISVILVVDASSTAYSVTPLLFGFNNFDKNVHMAGVIFNKVASKSHYMFLQEAATDAGVKCLGYIPCDERLLIKSRHLGLHLPNENNNIDAVEAASELIENHVSVNSILELTRYTPKNVHKRIDNLKNIITTAIAFDDAFNFSYQANIDALLKFGNVMTFSPLDDIEVPEADLIWFPGGYPELYAKRLSDNELMHKSIKKHIDDGKPVIAECGGMMYLGKSLQTQNGDKYNMVNVFSFNTSFEKMKLHLGYREIGMDDFELRGHEFHFSELTELNEEKLQFKVKTARGKTVFLPVFRYKNCQASYMHLYLGEFENLIKLLISLNVKGLDDD